ncbi:MAG: hypothetical protein O2958_14635 [Gemmatimonadetes bacterium]|nr:hypothetical protein [Gemmatimonadota bacterium]MDA1104380.1 hypothetical protein [Gemmatimonadota bacterium]
MSENTNEHRLPPPAFPPGTRKRVQKDAPPSSPKLYEPEPGESAFIAPDDPMPERIDAIARAFISPGDPMPERKIELAFAFRQEESVDPDEEGQVVGMDLNPHTGPDEVASGGDPHVLEVMRAVAKLAESLKRRGEAAFRSAPEMSRFEATLRAYCVGYVAGRRAGEPPVPEMDEALPSDF